LSKSIGTSKVKKLRSKLNVSNLKNNSTQKAEIKTKRVITLFDFQGSATLVIIFQATTRYPKKGQNPKAAVQNILNRSEPKNCDCKKTKTSTRPKYQDILKRRPNNREKLKITRNHMEMHKCTKDSGKTNMPRKDTKYLK
jgi:hypothetical protein